MFLFSFSVLEIMLPISAACYAVAKSAIIVGEGSLAGDGEYCVAQQDFTYGYNTWE